MEIEYISSLFMVIHFYPELWSISKDISIKGKLAGEEEYI